MKILGYFLLGYFLVFCKGQKNAIEQEVTQIRLVNNSNYKLTNIMVFSMPFSDLNLKDSTDYRILNYNSLKDDPLLYLQANNENFALYIKIPDHTYKYSYSIDSIQIENNLVYVSLHEKK